MVQLTINVIVAMGQLLVNTINRAILYEYPYLGTLTANILITYS